MTATVPPVEIRSEERPLHPDDLLSKHEVLKHLSISATTLYQGVRIGIYPRPLKIGLRRTAWRGSDIIKLKQLIFEGVLSAPDGKERLRAEFA